MAMNDMKSLVSVLIPAYNTSKYIGKCIESVIGQTYNLLEIIIVDDGSTDNTSEVVRDYMSMDNRIKFISIPHSGVASARNTCLKYATGEYVLYVDSDDWIDSNFCMLLLQQACLASADIVFSLMTLFYESGDGENLLFGDRSELFCKSKILNGKDCFIKMVNSGCVYPMISGNFYKRVFLQKNLLVFEGAYHEDELFMPKSLLSAKTITYCNDTLYYYRQREGSIMHSSEIMRDRALCLYAHAKKILDYFLSSPHRDNTTLFEVFTKHYKNLVRRSKSIYENYLKISGKACILITTKDAVGNNYGIGTYIEALQQCFNPHKWDVLIITLYSQKKYFDFSIGSHFVKYDFTLPQNHCDMNNDLIQKKYECSVFYYVMTLLYKRQLYVWFNFPTGDHMIDYLRQKTNAKIYYTMHYSDWSFILNGDMNELKRILLHPNNRFEINVRDSFIREKNFLTNKCDRIIAISKHSKQTLHNLYEIPSCRISHIYNTIPEPQSKRTLEKYNQLRNYYGIRPEHKIILFVGRIDIIKGINVLIDGFHLLLNDQTYSNCHLIIVGDGNMNEARERAFPNWHNIHFLGRINKALLSELYLLSDIGIIPSRYEEFGYVYLEMIMHGVPTIANSIGGLHEISQLQEVPETIINTPEDIKKSLQFELRKCPIFISEKKLTINKEFQFETFRNNIAQLFDLPLD